MSLRAVEEKACAYYFLVDDFRNTTLGLIRSHFKQAGDDGRASRIEVLPVSWHGALHGEETGIDKQLQNITLKSIPRLRHFTNDTLLDILFYTSPVYCQVCKLLFICNCSKSLFFFCRRLFKLSGTRSTECTTFSCNETQITMEVCPSVVIP